MTVNQLGKCLSIALLRQANKLSVRQFDYFIEISSHKLPHFLKDFAPSSLGRLHLPGRDILAKLSPMFSKRGAQYELVVPPATGPQRTLAPCVVPVGTDTT